MFTTLRKKIAVDQIVYPWNIGLTCGNCSQQFTVTRRKKHCVFCNASFCTFCIERRPDKRLSCHKCIVLTARPINRQELFNLKSRDLVAYLSSRHISTTDCIEKEDLVNAVIRSVNIPPSYVRRSNSGSCPTSPQRTTPNVFAPSTSYSQDDLSAMDGIRVNGIDSDSSTANTSPDEPFVMVEPSDCVNVDGSAEDQTQPGESSPLPRKWILLSDIPNLQHLESLSIRQLKELLAFNRIDFTGVVEKPELMEKASRLWVDYQEARKDVEKLRHEDLCKICMDAPIECVLLECGHICTCTQCGKQLNECPLCRQFVVRCVRTFRA